MTVKSLWARLTRPFRKTPSTPTLEERAMAALQPRVKATEEDERIAENAMRIRKEQAISNPEGNRRGGLPAEGYKGSDVFAFADGQYVGKTTTLVDHGEGGGFSLQDRIRRD